MTYLDANLFIQLILMLAIAGLFAWLMQKLFRATGPPKGDVDFYYDQHVNPLTYKDGISYDVFIKHKDGRIGTGNYDVETSTWKFTDINGNTEYFMSLSIMYWLYAPKEK